MKNIPDLLYDQIVERLLKCADEIAKLRQERDQLKARVETLERWDRESQRTIAAYREELAHGR